MNKFELINLSQKFVEEFKSFNIQLDYSLQSLNKLEDYLEANFKNNKPKRNSFFADDTEPKTLAFGAYLGEVVRRNGSGVKWIVENVDSPLEFTLTTPDGATAFAVNKAFKRIFNGSEDNTYHFAFQLLNDLMKYEEEIPDDYFDADDLRIIKYQNSHIAHYSKSIKTNGNIIKTAIYVEGQWYFFWY